MDNARTGLGGAFAEITEDSDALILVDECDREVGHLSKALCHSGRGVLHRAFDTVGAEHELCSVFIGKHSGRLRVNRDEIESWRWVSPEALQAEIGSHGSAQFTPWFLIEWARVWRDHRAEVAALQTQGQGDDTVQATRMAAIQGL